jgi:hypothetical protein
VQLRNVSLDLCPKGGRNWGLAPDTFGRILSHRDTSRAGCHRQNFRILHRNRGSLPICPHEKAVRLWLGSTFTALPLPRAHSRARICVSASLLYCEGDFPLFAAAVIPSMNFIYFVILRSCLRLLSPTSSRSLFQDLLSAARIVASFHRLILIISCTRGAISIIGIET